MRNIGLITVEAAASFVEKIHAALAGAHNVIKVSDTAATLSLDGLVVVLGTLTKPSQKQLETLLGSIVENRINNWLPMLFVYEAEKLSRDMYLTPPLAPSQVDYKVLLENVKALYQRKTGKVYPKLLAQAKDVLLPLSPGEEDRIPDRLTILKQGCDNYQKKLRSKAILPFAISLLIAVGFVVLLAMTIRSSSEGKKAKSKDPVGWSQEEVAAQNGELSQLLTKLEMGEVLPTREEVRLLNKHWKWLPILLDGQRRAETGGKRLPEDILRSLEKNWARSLEFIGKYQAKPASAERTKLLASLLDRVFDPSPTSELTNRTKSFWADWRVGTLKKLEEHSKSSFTLDSLLLTLQESRSESQSYKVHEPASRDVIEQELDLAIAYLQDIQEKKGLTFRVRPITLKLGSAVPSKGDSATLRLTVKETSVTWNIIINRKKNPAEVVLETQDKTLLLDETADVILEAQGQELTKLPLKLPLQRKGPVLLPGSKAQTVTASADGVEVNFTIEPLLPLPTLLADSLLRP